jgi:hypothetical protein
MWDIGDDGSIDHEDPGYDEFAGGGDLGDECAPQPSVPRMHGDIPITGYNRGEPIPDLSVLARERWREALVPLSPFTRQLSKATVSSRADAIAAGILVGGLTVEAPAPRLGGPPPALPRSVGDPPARGARRQVNFRLSPDEHARLLRAARAFGMRPGALARLFTVRAVDRALYEERRDR